MSKNFLMALVLLALCHPCFAGVTISPDSLDLSLVGGETIVETITVSGDFSSNASVSLEAIVSSESKDTNGFLVEFEPESFVLLPGQSVDVDVKFLAVSNISPEKYSVEIKATAAVLVKEPAKPVTKPIYSGSGAGWITRPATVDENVIDENMAVIVPIPRPPTPCVTEGEPFWHRKCCEGLVKSETTCEIFVETPPEKPIEPIDSESIRSGLFGLTPLQFGVIGFFTLFFLGLAGLLSLLKRKRKKNKEEKNHE